MIIYICLSETLAAHYWVNKLTLIFKIISNMVLRWQKMMKLVLGIRHCWFKKFITLLGTSIFQ